MRKWLVTWLACYVVGGLKYDHKARIPAVASLAGARWNVAMKARRPLRVIIN
jgi:hypothetical protein